VWNAREHEAPPPSEAEPAPHGLSAPSSRAASEAGPSNGGVSNGGLSGGVPSHGGWSSDPADQQESGQWYPGRAHAGQADAGQADAGQADAGLGAGDSVFRRKGRDGFLVGGDRELGLAIYTEELFATGNDVDNRAAVRAVPTEKLALVGIAVHGSRNAVDKTLKGLSLHP